MLLNYEEYPVSAYSPTDRRFALCYLLILTAKAASFPESIYPLVNESHGEFTECPDGVNTGSLYPFNRF